MREIKFRAWDGEQMLYRGLCDRNWYNAEDKQVCTALPEDARNWKIMQYTGFKTEDGTEIYEDDIVRIGTEYNNLSQKHGTPVYEAVRMIHGRWEPLCFFKDALFSVYGSIYENPELLRVGDVA
ncbi:hypothetical protein QFZ60_001547 [Arthrobacter sp. B2I5]|uniref:YopX family protein n=1 Tax=Arthrobacter sp. B2I5 TaxID=3042266 RepID=UPI002782DF7A|nr:YopX family protein [Arthrobacter sp. B2I5]MDQ0825374.1 hypothetical protein [Arthrobacter sp. B2I5]